MIAPVVPGSPEELFGLSDVDLVGPGTRVSMTLGDGGGDVSLGRLGVLVDDVTGYALHASRPSGLWPVSSEIHLSAAAPITRGSTRLEAEGIVVHASNVEGLATGHVHDESGALVAVCHQRGRFVAVEGSPTYPGAPTSVTGVPFERLSPSEITLEVLAPVINPLGSLHGGVSIYLIDKLAMSMVSDRTDPPFATASLHVAYRRPLREASSVTFRGTVHHLGRSLAVIGVEASSGDRIAVRATVVAQRLPGAGAF